MHEMFNSGIQYSIIRTRKKEKKVTVTIIWVIARKSVGD